ncbi:unnamed protein product [Symbiodinium natans]|uniref:Uncharacterized protein n=1 Tax=Symbiodinium natans TaxID=878477 RepID=A0A812NXM5_9DINO|nr:unnamed protein product [Symbiodinium natans]
MSSHLFALIWICAVHSLHVCLKNECMYHVAMPTHRMRPLLRLGFLPHVVRFCGHLLELVVLNPYDYFHCGLYSIQAMPLLHNDLAVQALSFFQSAESFFDTEAIPGLRLQVPLRSRGSQAAKPMPPLGLVHGYGSPLRDSAYSTRGVLVCSSSSALAACLGMLRGLHHSAPTAVPSVGDAALSLVGLLRLSYVDDGDRGHGQLWLLQFPGTWARSVISGRLTASRVLASAFVMSELIFRSRCRSLAIDSQMVCSSQLLLLQQLTFKHGAMLPAAFSAKAFLSGVAALLLTSLTPSRVFPLLCLKRRLTCLLVAAELFQAQVFDEALQPVPTERPDGVKAAMLCADNLAPNECNSATEVDLTAAKLSVEDWQ